MPKVEGSRVLRKLIPAVRIKGDNETDTYAFDPGQGGSGWTLVNNGTSTAMLVWRGYFDLSGWVREDLTAFVLGVDFQEANTHRAVNLQPGGAIHMWNIATKRLVDQEDFVFGTADNLWLAPGMANSRMDLEEVFAGENRSFSPDVNLLGNVIQFASRRWGAGDATAGDRIHITKVYYLGGNVGTGGVDSLTIPPSAVVIPVTLVKESDMVYMERLRRSYVLGTSTD